jgi:hypothetical protein
VAAQRDRTENDYEEATFRLGWLEWCLLAAALVLLLQFFPQPLWWILGVLDFREWSRTTWFILNVVFLAVVFGIYLWRER